MKPSSSPSEPHGPDDPYEAAGAGDSLLGPLSGVQRVDAEVSDRALLQAMLDCERALAEAGADAGVVPADAVTSIAAACKADRFDLSQLGRDAQAAGNPVVPLVRAIDEQLPAEAKPWLHHGGTSQDILDTALLLCVGRALDAAELQGVLAAVAALVREHRRTLMPARTLGQQAGPTTFGLKASGWLTGLVQAQERLDEARAALPAQLGGATGTLAAFGDAGPVVLERFATRLGLATPVAPWHTNRQSILRLAAALGAMAAACGKVAMDIALLAQTEIAEVSEGASGGSSALPHKQNPVGSVLIIALARRTPGLVATLYDASLHEHERAFGSWHAEWEPLRELARLAGAASVRTGRVLRDLQVHPDKMRANLDLTRGLVMSESVVARLAPSLGRTAAHKLLTKLGEAATAGNTTLREQLLGDPGVRHVLTADEIDEALDPAGWLGSADTMIDRALDAQARRSKELA
jgi:3-carboxy-cis,cis-muconate cycloisomerase